MLMWIIRRRSGRGGRHMSQWEMCMPVPYSYVPGQTATRYLCNDLDLWDVTFDERIAPEALPVILLDAVRPLDSPPVIIDLVTPDVSTCDVTPMDITLDVDDLRSRLVVDFEPIMIETTEEIGVPMEEEHAESNDKEEEQSNGKEEVSGGEYEEVGVPMEDEHDESNDEEEQQSSGEEEDNGREYETMEEIGIPMEEEREQFNDEEEEEQSSGEAEVSGGEYELTEWEKVDEKLAIDGLGVASLLVLWASTGLISAIDKLPLLPGFFEFIGIVFSGWFTYRYLRSKPDRSVPSYQLWEELLKIIDEDKGKITGQ